MEQLVEDFLVYLRHERGQSEHTQRTYAALLGKFVDWARTVGVTNWRDVRLQHLQQFLQHERSRRPDGETAGSLRRLSTGSLYLEVAALRAFFRFAADEKLLPGNAAENLSLPRRWKRLPKSLTGPEIDRLLQPVQPATPATACDQAVLELAYASGLRLAELRALRLHARRGSLAERLGQQVANAHADQRIGNDVGFEDGVEIDHKRKQAAWRRMRFGSGHGPGRMQDGQGIRRAQPP